MDLIREVLLRIEKSEEAWTRFDGIDAKHVALLLDAGWVEGSLIKSNMHGIGAAVVERLTWEGHNFLDTIREDKVWESTRDRVLKPGASWTISFLLEVAKAEIRKHLGLP